MKNKLPDLTDHLFAQLERLGQEDLVAEKLRDEISRAGAITSCANQIIAAGRLAVDAQRAVNDAGVGARAPSILGLEKLSQGTLN